MWEVYYLLKRNILLYIRDYVSVFFSVLSMLIVLALMVIFLGDMNSGNVVEALAQYGNVQDIAMGEENVAYLIEQSVRDALGSMDGVDVEDALAYIGGSIQGAAMGDVDGVDAADALVHTDGSIQGTVMENIDSGNVGGVLAHAGGSFHEEAMEDMGNGDGTDALAQYREMQGSAVDAEGLVRLIEAVIRDFLGNMDSEAVAAMLAQLGGGTRDTEADEENASYLIQMWTLAGILEVNAITITLMVMGTMVQDETKNRLASFYMAPVKRMKIALGYILSAWVVGIGMCVLTFAMGEIYMALCGHPLLAAADCLALLGMIVLNVFTYASLAYLLALFIHSESAWSSIFTIIGTLVGFVGAIYLPMSMLPEGVGKVLKCLPVLHGAAMMRVVCTRDAIAQTFAGLPEAAGDAFREQMGVTIFMDGKEISLQYQILFLGGCAIIAIIVSAWNSKRRKLRDR